MGRTGRCAGPSPPLPHGPAAGRRLWQRHLPRLTLVHSHLSPPQPPRKYSPSPSTLCSLEPPGSQIPFARTARLAPLRGSGNFQMTACATPGWRETQERGREGFLSHLTPFHCSCTSPPGPRVTQREDAPRCPRIAWSFPRICLRCPPNPPGCPPVRLEPPLLPVNQT